MELELPGAGFFGAAPVPEPIFWSKAAPAASFWKEKRKMKEPVPEPYYPVFNNSETQMIKNFFR